MLLRRSSFTALSSGGLRGALCVVIEASQDIARRRRIEVLGLFALDGLFAGGLERLGVSTYRRMGEAEIDAPIIEI